jgi:CheY-like chemotaxis protein
MTGDKERILGSGCSHYISKPFKKNDLLNLVKDALLQAG